MEDHGSRETITPGGGFVFEEVTSSITSLERPWSPWIAAADLPPATPLDRDHRHAAMIRCSQHAGAPGRARTPGSAQRHPAANRFLTIFWLIPASRACHLVISPNCLAAMTEHRASAWLIIPALNYPTAVSSVARVTLGSGFRLSQPYRGGIHGNLVEADRGPLIMALLGLPEPRVTSACKDT
jgi:hypothetical protein